MADILTPKQRSALMARIRSVGNASTELRLVAVLRAARISGWRRGCRLRLRRQRADGGRRGTEGRGRTAAGGGGGGQFTFQEESPERGASEKTAGGRGLKHRATVGHPCSSAKFAATDCRPSFAVGRPLTVKPDFVFRKERLVVFVDGCFWHGCPSHYTRPKARRVFWDAKIAANRARDRRLDRTLRAAGWRVLRLWEHALTRRLEGQTVARIRRALWKAKAGRKSGGVAR